MFHNGKGCPPPAKRQQADFGKCEEQVYEFHDWILLFTNNNGNNVSNYCRCKAFMYNTNERGLGTMDLDEETRRLYYMLSPQGKIEFDRKYENEKKKPWAYYLWLIFLGRFGAHKFYLGESGMGILYIFTGGIFGIGLLYDLCTGVSQVKHFNEAYFRNTITVIRTPIATDNFIEAPKGYDEGDNSIPNVGL